MKSLLVLLLGLFPGLFLGLAPSTAVAAFSFPTLSQDNLDAIEKDIAANTTLHDALPASSLGSIFGFELGLVGGLTKSADINALVQQVSPSTDAGYLPHAGLVGAVTVPGGLTVEAMYLPKQSFSEVSYQQYAFGLKWTMSDGIMVLPLNLAVRGFYGKSQLDFNQTVTDPNTSQPVAVTGTNAMSVTGIQLLASPKWIPILEPYAGIGYLRGNGEMSVSGATTGTMFSFTSSQSASSSPTSTQLLIGLDVRLLLIGLGAEWSRAFGTDTYTAKLSVKF